MEHFNRLTPAEAERLSLLLEEMAEATQIIGKVLRHGYDSYHPNDPAKVQNRDLLEVEVGHVQHAIDRMTLATDIDVRAVNQAKVTKGDTVSQWLHHQDGR